MPTLHVGTFGVCGENGTALEDSGKFGVFRKRAENEGNFAQFEI